MKSLLLGLLLLGSLGHAKERYLFTGDGFDGVSMTTTTVGQTNQGYWVFNDLAGGGTYTVENNATFGSLSSKMVVSTWGSSSNTKTSYVNGLLTAHVGTGGRNILATRISGAVNGTNMHAVNGYAVQWLAGGLYGFEGGAGGWVQSISHSVSVSSANNYYLGIKCAGTIISLYVSDNPITVSSVPNLTFTDSTWTSGGIMTATFATTAWFDLIRFDDLTASGNRSIKLLNNIKLRLGLFQLLVPINEAWAQPDQISESMRNKFITSSTRQREHFLRITPTATSTAMRTVAPTATPTTTPVP